MTIISVSDESLEEREMDTLFYLIILVLDIWAIYNIFKSSAEMMMKVIWTLVVLVLPIIGLIIWYFKGPKGA